MRLIPGLALTLILMTATACEPVALLEMEISLEATTVAPPRPRPASQDGPCFASGCHAELQDTTRPHPHQSFASEACFDCHAHFHTLETQRLYTQSDIAACAACHGADTMGVTHPVGEGVTDPNTGQLMTCTSTCHRQHTAPYPYLLAKAGEGELCLACHTDLLSQ